MKKIVVSGSTQHIHLGVQFRSEIIRFVKKISRLSNGISRNPDKNISLTKRADQPYDLRLKPEFHHLSPCNQPFTHPFAPKPSRTPALSKVFCNFFGPNAGTLLCIYLCAELSAYFFLTHPSIFSSSHPSIQFVHYFPFSIIRLHVDSSISLTVYPFVIHSSIHPTVHASLHFISISTLPSALYLSISETT